MLVSYSWISVIKDFEGLELTAYPDGGRWSIGYGCSFYEDGTAVKSGDKISYERAEKLFTWMINNFSVQVDGLIKLKVNQNQFESLTSLAYNIGITAFSNSTLLKLVNKNPDDPAIRAEFAKWRLSQGKIIPNLVNRREREANHYFTPSSGFDFLKNQNFQKFLVFAGVALILVKNRNYD